MVDRCENCDRDGCREATSATWAAFVACSCVPNLRDPCEHQRAFHVADAACYDHTVNWRERAKAAESDLTALRERMAVADLRLTRIAERATAMTRAGVGAAEPWAQAGKVIRETGYELLALVGPLPAAPEVQAVAQKTAAFRPTPEQMRMGVFSEADLDLDGVDL